MSSVSIQPEQTSEQGPATGRRTRAPGDRSRARILEQATRLATIEGLEGLSIGRLAEATGMPKSSVYVLFGSKEELQLATVGAAREQFATEVVIPALSAAEPGRELLLALCEGYLDHVERRVFPGGCFFVAASAELGARPGRLHHRVAARHAGKRRVRARSAARAHRPRPARVRARSDPRGREHPQRLTRRPNGDRPGTHRSANAARGSRLIIG